MKAKFTIILAAALVAFASAVSAQTTIGTGAVAQSGVVIGNNAVSGDIAAGTLSPTQPAYTGGIAIGNGANASGKNIAIGDGISAPQDGVAGMYTFAIGGLNMNTGTIEFRRIVGVANGLFGSDGANMQNVWTARDIAISAANSYADVSISNALVPVNVTLANHDNRLGGVEALSANNATRLDQHDVVLADHDKRITAVQSTATTAMTVASTADGKATTAIATAQDARAIAVATSARVDVVEQQVANLDGRVSSLKSKVSGMNRDYSMGIAGVAAMTAPMPALAPGERALVLGTGGYNGYASVGAVVAYNHRGSIVSAGAATANGGPVWKASVAFKF